MQGTEGGQPLLQATPTPQLPLFFPAHGVPLPWVTRGLLAHLPLLQAFPTPQPLLPPVSHAVPLQWGTKGLQARFTPQYPSCPPTPAQRWQPLPHGHLAGSQEGGRTPAPQHCQLLAAAHPLAVGHGV